MCRLSSGTGKITTPSLTLVATLFLAGSCGTAAAEPTLSPIVTGVRVFDDPVTTKYVLFNAPIGIMHAGGVMSWYYNDLGERA